MPDDQIGVKIQFHLFSSTDGRLTMLDLDAEQIIRSAPLPRLYAASSISALSSSSKSNNNKNLHNQRLSEFFQRYRSLMASSSTPYTFPAPNNNNNNNKREAIESVDNLRNETTGKEAKSARIIKEEEKDIEEEVEKNEEE
uniref:Uncharacterized protein n=1 Tax=Meloidogyne floridensis TaxID=298350 RepID=A0A915NPS5_9BILA